MAEIAELTDDLLHVDAGLTSWASTSHPLAGSIYAPALDAAEWTSRSDLATVTTRVKAEAGNAPSLLRLLDVAPPPGRRTATTDAASARSALLTARDWMHRDAGDVRAAHLASATRLESPDDETSLLSQRTSEASEVSA